MDREINFDNHNCLICGQFCKNRRSLGNHINRTHKTTIKDYVLKFYLNNEVPKCLCGCGKEVTWSKSTYKYRKYISGHNAAGFSTNGWKPSQEQIDKRNVAIRKAYKERGDEIKEKISDSLKKTFKDPVIKEKLSKAQKNIWSNEDYKERMSKLRKDMWKERGDELREKIFTKEFGRKISLSNMKRSIKRESKKEKEFIKHLIDVFGKESIISKGKWLSCEDRTRHYDVYMPSKKLLIEFDGVYWHGLDREECFTNDQLRSMANDLQKNRFAKMLGYSLIRVNENVSISNISSFQDLIENSYYYQENGEIIKDNMFKLKDDNTPLISRNYLLKIDSKTYLENTRNNIVSYLKEYVHAYGWFYPQETGDLSTVVSSLHKRGFNKDAREISSLTAIGNNFLKSHFKSFWEVNGGPLESFHNDQKLNSVVSYRVGLNNSKPYTYILDDGEIITKNETFDITLSNIRKGFIVQRNSVSWFKPTAAFEIYKMFIDKEDPVVWDPSCGFGARLLGFHAAFPNGTYIGTEPATKTYGDIQKFCKKFNIKAEIHQMGSEEIKIDKELDLVFTSPPYFNKEKYFNESTQCWNKYDQKSEWRKSYLNPTFQTAFDNLKEEGLMVINIDDDCYQSVIEEANDVGFLKKDEIDLIIGSDHFSKSKGNLKKKVEKIIIFSKQQ